MVRLAKTLQLNMALQATPGMLSGYHWALSKQSENHDEHKAAPLLPRTEREMDSVAARICYLG